MSWQVKPAVKRLVEFRQLNLIDPWVISPKPDIVFLRNVLIYFELQTRRTILDRVRSQLAPGGALFLGAAESTLNVAEGWERIVIEKYTYYKVQT
jgi:chemotaxis protein methyltransferase CheR